MNDEKSAPHQGGQLCPCVPQHSAPASRTTAPGEDKPPANPLYQEWMNSTCVRAYHENGDQTYKGGLRHPIDPGKIFLTPEATKLSNFSELSKPLKFYLGTLSHNGVSKVSNVSNPLVQMQFDRKELPLPPYPYTQEKKSICPTHLSLYLNLSSI